MKGILHMKTHFILILALGACLCTTCQQNATLTPAGPVPVNESTVTPQSATGTAGSTPVSGSTAVPKPDPDTEEYAVYNDLLASRFSRGDIEQVLIIDHTRVNEPKLLEQDLKTFHETTALSPEMVASFKERNQQPHLLKPALDFGMEYQLWTQEEVDELRSLDEASGWKLFYEKYPDTYGFIYLSRVGFNADFSQALVYMESYHYEQPIQGGYYLMVRKDGHWVIDNSYEWMT